MKSVYESIMTGLNEAIEDAQSEGKKLNRRTVTIIPVKEYGAEQVRNIRNSVGMSQSTFAGYLGVTKKTVEAWEAGTNHPSGAASRILNILLPRLVFAASCSFKTASCAAISSVSAFSPIFSPSRLLTGTSNSSAILVSI